MKVKVSEATGPVLNWLVAKCKGEATKWDSDEDAFVFFDREEGGDRHYAPSTDWAQGGPIIEREGITLRNFIQGDAWDAELGYERTFLESGPTPLIAAMRCYVASNLGDEVEVPEELL